MKQILAEKRKRTRIDIAQSTYEALRSVANERHQSIALTLDFAIELLQWAQETHLQGSKILAIGKGVAEP